MSLDDTMQRLMRDGEVTIRIPQEPTAWAEAVIPTLDHARNFEPLRIWWNSANTQAGVDQLAPTLRERLTNAVEAAFKRIHKQAA